MCDDVTAIVQDIYLVDFYERKYNTSLLVGCPELTCLLKHYKDYNYLSSTKPLHDFTKLSHKIETTLSTKYPLLYEILLLGKGKLSLCGRYLFEILTGLANSIVSFDVYFHSCNEEEAKKILLQCLDRLEGNIYYNGNIVSSTPNYSVEFSFTIYKNKKELITNIGITPIRHGYDPINKYFSTVPAIISIAARMSPLDIVHGNKGIFSYNYMGIFFLFHGINKNIVDRQGSANIPLYNCKGNKLSYGMNNIQRCFGDIHYKQRDMVRSGEIIFTLFSKPSYQRFDPRIRFGKDYEPIIIGISDDRYIAFSKCREIYNMDPCLFQLLCYYWLKAEVLDAKTRLLK